MSSDSVNELSPDLTFDLLSSARRRMVLYYLRSHNGEATVNELAEEIAALENDVDVEDLSRQQQKRVYVSLYQTHLPKLADAGIVEYDEEESIVRLTSRANSIDSYLTPTEEGDYPWGVHYLLLTVISGGLLLGSWAEFPIVADIPSLWLGLAITAAFAASAGLQYRAQRRRRQEVPVELRRDE